MKQIELLPLDDAALAGIMSDVTAYAEGRGLRVAGVADGVVDVARQCIEFFARVPRLVPWGGYLVVDLESRCVVGTGGFKSAPDAEGMIEIAYGTFPPYEGQGYATATAAALTALANAAAEVRLVIAHTLPEPNALTRVLQRNGFRFAGEVMDPEDGRVWRWERIAIASGG